jgi:segregation and condensation protein B
MNSKELRETIEVLLFSSDTPLTLKRMQIFTKGVSQKEILEAIDDLNVEYGATGRIFEIRALAGGYQMVTRKEFGDLARQFHKHRNISRLTPAALETLAIIAYQQPITRLRIEEVRGVDVSGVLQTLLERRMIRITGRDKGIGRPLLYGTTDEFLRYFGINDLSDLPNHKETLELLQKKPNYSADNESVAREELHGD